LFDETTMPGSDDPLHGSSTAKDNSPTAETNLNMYGMHPTHTATAPGVGNGAVSMIPTTLKTHDVNLSISSPAKHDPVTSILLSGHMESSLIKPTILQSYGHNRKGR
jgi:hypothetical protein